MVADFQVKKGQKILPLKRKRNQQSPVKVKMHTMYSGTWPTQYLWRTSCVQSPAPGAEDPVMNNRRETLPAWRDSGVRFALENRVVMESLAEKRSLIRHLKEWGSEPVTYLGEGVPGGGSAMAKALRLHGLEGKSWWLCSGRYVEGELGPPHLSVEEWDLTFEASGSH